ncbi:MAG TPA: cytochrome c [Xanthobacteraceae bacterium]
MIRAALTIIAIAFAITAVTAQSDPIAARQALMKTNGRQAKLGSDMIRGNAPFDVEKARGIFASFIDAAGKMPNLFPENSKAGGETTASPEIWVHLEDVKSRFAKFAADSKAAQDSTKDLDSFRAAFRSVAQNCDSCHERYRAKKS